MRDDRPQTPALGEASVCDISETLSLGEARVCDISDACAEDGRGEEAHAVGPDEAVL